MSAQPEQQQSGADGITPHDKGKGKAVQQDDVSMGEDDDDDDDSSEEEEEAAAEDPANPSNDESESELEEIEMDNIVGSRTRGKVIDYAKAAAENPEDEDDDEEDDEDFEEPDDEEMQG